MGKKKIAIGVLIFFVIIAVALSYFMSDYFQKEEPIGGQTDEHGCLTGAGYSFDGEVGACTRVWELDAGEKEAATKAIQTLNSAPSVTVVSVEKGTCEKCYNVTLQRNDNRVTSTIEVTLDKTYCSEESRQGEFCTEIYAPVCGIHANGTKETFGNSCFACHSEITTWIDGEC